MADRRHTRVLVVAPHGRDAATAQKILSEAGISSEVYPSVAAMCAELVEGVSCVALAEEVLTMSSLSALSHFFDQQPAWSDLPLIVFASLGEVTHESLSSLGALERFNMTILERPLRLRTFVATVRAAIRARRRQYQVRELLSDQAKDAEEKRKLLIAAEEARAQAESANRAKDDFLAMVSHELRTPLNAILGWSELLPKMSNDHEKWLGGAKTIRRNAEAQKKLIEDLLDFSSIVSKRVNVDLRVVDLGTVIEAAVDSIRLSAQAKGMRIDVRAHGEGHTVLGDADRLRQVVTNLLQNAVKFTPPAGLVRVEFAREGGEVRVAVLDNGPGITPDVLPHVFERFRQGDNSITRAHGGLGLGLAIVRELVHLHEGRVEAHSGGVGKGARLEFRLPFAETPPMFSHPSTPVPGHAPSLAGLHILVIDDEPDALELVRVVLESADARVSTAISAREGFELLTKERPDVLLCDIAMPGEDGYSFIRRVRELGPDNGGKIPAAACTAFGRAEDRRRAMIAGFNLYITKPVDTTELVMSLAQLAPERARRPTPADAAR